MKKGNKKGFTLIELLVVVAIIGILAAIAIPKFAAYREKAARSTAESDAGNLKLKLEEYYQENGSYPEAASVPDNIGDKYSTDNDAQNYAPYADFQSGYSFQIYNSKYGTSKFISYDSSDGVINKDSWSIN